MNHPLANTQLRRRQKRYLAFRIMILISLSAVLLAIPESINATLPGQFAAHFSILHLFWAMWMIYMTTKLLPFRRLHNHSEFRQFAASFKARVPYPGKEIVQKHIRTANIQALKSAAAWLVLTAFIGVMRKLHLIQERGLLILSGIFYVCDLICVIYYCPFQHLLMKNRCCNTCRIYNWDALMMFTPMVFTRGFFGLSLFAMSALVFLFWEFRFLLHPERFLQITNANIQCTCCPDHLCKVH